MTNAGVHFVQFSIMTGRFEIRDVKNYVFYLTQVPRTFLLFTCILKVISNFIGTMFFILCDIASIQLSESIYIEMIIEERFIVLKLKFAW